MAAAARYPAKRDRSFPLALRPVSARGWVSLQWAPPIHKPLEPHRGSAKYLGGDVTRPRVADDFAAIRARMEELRRERAQALKGEAPDTDETGLGGRGLLKRLESRHRPEPHDLPTGLPSRRYGSTR